MPQVLVIPDGDLLGLPFDALIEELPRTTEPSFETLPYLIHRYAFSYAHSASTWAQNRRYKVQRLDKHLLAMDASYAIRDSYPFNFNHENLAEFVHIQRQTALLRGFIPGISFSDQAATEAELKRWLPQSNLFHLVAHLRANPYRALSAGFLLSAYGTGEDHILQGVELALLPLQLDLAVFPNGSESIETQALMARCLMFAGSPSVAFSFWPMDNMSNNFIIEYYYQWLKYRYSKSEALQISKLNYLAHSRGLDAHPRYWAGLSQWGEIEPIEVQDIRRWWAWAIGFSLVAGVGLGILRWWYKEHQSHTEAISYWERRRREKQQKRGRRI
jgi:CHAT domain-containing protein